MRAHGRASLQDLAARSAFPTSYTALARLGEAVPTDDNVPSLIYQLQGAASGAGVDFRALQLQANSSTAAVATPSSATKPSTGAPGSAAAASSLAGALPPGATVGTAGFPEEQFTLSFQGNFFHLSNFFKRLEAFVVATNKSVSISGRLMTLNAFSLGPAPTQGFPQITASIAATTYLVPSSQGLFNGASPIGPSSSSSQTVSGSSSTTPPTAAITP